MEQLGNTINPVMLYEVQKYHPGLWQEVPPSSALIIGPDPDERLPFTPRPPV